MKSISTGHGRPIVGLLAELPRLIPFSRKQFSCSYISCNRTDRAHYRQVKPSNECRRSVLLSAGRAIAGDRFL